MRQAFTGSIVEDAALRDTLLPKLIFGELRGKGAERIVALV